MRHGHWKLVGQTPVPCTVKEWAAQFGDIDSRRVFLTRIGPFEVSTVFLGLDHNWSRHGPPILFETMTFLETPDPYTASFDDNECDGRDATWIEAEARHRRAIEFLRVNYCAPGEEPEEITLPVPKDMG